jgi:DNA-binding transcriptional MerR regulator
MRYMKSGEFAKLCGTTKNTLIHYDSIGLMSPSRIGDNGYRYYTLRDYWKFVAIRTFAETGFPLEEIRSILREGREDALLAEVGSLRTRLLERLASIEDALAQLDEMEIMLARSSSAAKGDPCIKSEPARTLLVCGSVEGMHPTAEFDYSLATALSAEAIRTMGAIGGRARLSPYGMTASFESGIVSYQDLFFLLPENVNLKTVPQSGLSVIDPGDYASIGFDGPWENIGSAYESLRRFIASKGLRQSSPYYEVARFWLADNQENDYKCEISVRVR